MDVVVEAWKAKVSNNDAKVKSCVPNKAPCKNTKNKSKSKDKRKKFKCKKLHNPSLAAIAKNTSENCCGCCGVLAEYFKEVLKLVCHRRCDGEPRIAELLKELLDIAGCICHDCFTLLRNFVGFFIDVKN